MMDGLESVSIGQVCVVTTAMDVTALPPALLRSGRVELWFTTRLPDERRAGSDSARKTQCAPAADLHGGHKDGGTQEPRPVGSGFEIGGRRGQAALRPRFGYWPRVRAGGEVFHPGHRYHLVKPAKPRKAQKTAIRRIE
jgi:hypothetical protein